MSNVPSKTAAIRWGGLNSSGAANEEDLLQIQGINDPQIKAWIDSSGFPWGNLRTPGPAGPPGAQGAQGAAGTSNVPWVDIQNYGGIPKAESTINANTTFNSTSGSPNITVGSALTHFVNGAGICLQKAGAATSQSTPSAPTITAPPMSGSQTITYKIVGVDALCGLTAASSSATVSAPAIFGPKAVAISSASASAGVITLNFAAPLNTTVVAGMTLHVVGVTGSGATWSGIYTIASAPTTQQVTYNCTGATGTGIVSGATGRVSNVAVITAISRNSSGVISVTTAEPHNFNVGTGAQPTIVILEGILTYDLNGHFVIASTPTSTTFTCNTGNLTAETGSLNTNGGTGLDFGGSLSAASATVYEYTQLACPALSGTTQQYYIYSDSHNPGGSLILIGKTLYGESHFRDYGPSIGGGFVAPVYVPTTPPASAQNQLFSTTILSGGGTTSLVLSANVPSSVTGGNCVYDDAPCLIAASNALPSSNGGGQILLSPPVTPNSITLPMYIFNSPITIPAGREIIVSSALWINETTYQGGYVKWTGNMAAAWTVAPGFSSEMRPILFGLASPMIQVGLLSQAETAGFVFSGIHIATTALNINGVYGLSAFGGFYGKIKNCSYDCGNGGTNVGLVLNGNAVSVELEDITYEGTSVYGNGQSVGQSSWCAPIGTIVIRTSDNPTEGNIAAARIIMKGINTSAGRGVLIDGQYGASGASNDFEFEQIWDQAPITPCIMFSGFVNNLSNIKINGINNDSESSAVLANWSQGVFNVFVENCEVTNQVTPLVTGNPIELLAVSGFLLTPTVGQSNAAGAAIPANLTTSNGTTTTVTVPGVLPSSHVTFTATNAAAATMQSTSPGIFVLSVSANTIEFQHGSGLAGATFNIIATSF